MPVFFNPLPGGAGVGIIVKMMMLIAQVTLNKKWEY